MFEKEAEEYFRDNAHNFDEVTACRECMEFGYNKANKWHYVKDRLPISDKDKYYFVVDKWNEPMIARFYCGKWSNYSVIDDVIAWKEIVLPELKESE